MDFEKLFDQSKEENLYGRYIILDHIEPVIEKLKTDFAVSVEGQSVQGIPVYSIVAGAGAVKVYMWSQMHGNESTTTKALFDFLNFLQQDNDFAIALKNHFTFCILPILNPDGAKAYTRENANGVDLNRDSVNLSQPESKILREVFEKFQPDYCYNMHDQRTIFGAGDSGLPATVSFLSPSYNDERDINDTRQTAINIIAAMNQTLQQYIPGQVGRFDDGFNINCIGDMFQSLCVPTILFEAGHYQEDYFREKTRKFIFIALLSGFKAIYENVIVVNKKDEYFSIPQNKVNFYDIIYKKVKINYENKQIITNFASHYSEELIENSVIFDARIREIGDLPHMHGHVEYDCNEAFFTDDEGGNLPEIQKKANFTVGKDRKFVNGVEINQ